VTAYIIGHLACIMHPADSKEKFMLMLTSYMDESGHSADPAMHFAAMAGFVAPLEVMQMAGAIWEKTSRKGRLNCKGHST